MIEFCRFVELHKIKRAAGSPADFKQIKTELEKGVSRFVKIFDTYFVLRVDGDVLTVVCAEGKNIKKASFIVNELACRLKLNFIEFHTKRPALARLLKRWNFKFYKTDSNNYQVFRMVAYGR